MKLSNLPKIKLYIRTAVCSVFTSQEIGKDQKACSASWEVENGGDLCRRPCITAHHRRTDRPASPHRETRTLHMRRRVFSPALCRSWEKRRSNVKRSSVEAHSLTETLCSSQHKTGLLLVFRW